MKKISMFFKILLFLSSYTPFFVMYLILDFDGIDSKFPFFKFGTFLAYLFVLFPLILFSVFILIRYFEKTPDATNVKILSISRMDNEVVSYLVTYIFPFLTFPENKKVLLILTFLFLVGVLYIRSGMIAINPILLLRGYHIIEISFTKDEWEKTKQGILISSVDPYELENKEKIKITNIQGNLYLLKEVIE